MHNMMIESKSIEWKKKKNIPIVVMHKEMIWCGVTFCAIMILGMIVRGRVLTVGAKGCVLK